MKKKIALSFLVMALMMALVGGATFAWFTDSETVTGNSFATGTLVVGLDNTSPLAGSNLAPGSSISKSGSIQNTGSLDAYYRVTLTSTNDPTLKGMAGTLSDKIQCTVVLNNGTPYTTTLKNVLGKTIFVGTINASNTIPYNVTLSMPNTVGNEAQGLTWSGSLELESTQVVNQGDTKVWE